MVGGIYNVILVVVLGEGMVMLENVFIDIDVVDVIEFLNVLGVCIEGVGINMIIIYGVKELYGGEYIVIFDCIEVGIFMMLVVVICLWFMLINVCFDYLCVVISKFVEMGVDIQEDGNCMVVDVCGCDFKLVNVIIQSYFGFFIDL